MRMNVYEYASYKNFLRDWIANRPGRGKVAELAQSAGCDRTYLSQVLNSKVQLTADHIINLAEHLELSESEKTYLLLLLLYERAANTTTRNLIKKKMDRVLQENLAVTKNIRHREVPNELNAEDKARYYSSWVYGAIHILTSCTEYRTAKAIAERLRIPEKNAEEILFDLSQMGLVIHEGGRYQHSSRNLYISADSAFNAMNHVNWRTRSLGQANSKDGIHYTSAFSISRKDWLRLKTQLLEFIEKQRSFVHASGSEELFCFCCDLFSPL